MMNHGHQRSCSFPEIGAMQKYRAERAETRKPGCESAWREPRGVEPGSLLDLKVKGVVALTFPEAMY